MGEVVEIGTGRPRKKDADKRRYEFLRLASQGVPFDEAARQARLDPWRALRLLSHPSMRPFLGDAA